MLASQLASANMTATVSSQCASRCVPETFGFPNTTIVSVESLSKDTVFQTGYGPSLCASYSTTALATKDICRVVVNVTDTPGSSIRMDAWLPADWNGRFLATGDGGIGGCIDYLGLQTGVQLGFATIGTNAGHDGETGYDFFLNNPAAVADWGYRAIHVEAEFGKQLLERFYGRQPDTSYYHGCSTGGRQGLQNAQLFPDDFDGVLAGAPAVDWLRIVASKPILARRTGWPDLESSSYVRPEQWRAIVKHQIALFDPIDGVTDGVIDDPLLFRYDPTLAACGFSSTFNSSLCLTPDQVASVRAVYEPLVNGSGAIVYPSFAVGADTSVFSANQVGGTAQLSYRVADDYWRGAVYNDSTWNTLNFTIADMDFAVELNPGGIAFAESNYTETHAKGVKIMAYHGMADQTVTPALSAEWFSKVQASTGLGSEAMNDFYRLFFLPGMGHCAGGSGATDVGQRFPLDPSRIDAEHNILLALVDWVEKGKAPDALIGGRYTAGNATQPLLADRKHCPYPQKSKWNGMSNVNISTSWDCVN